MLRDHEGGSLLVSWMGDSQHIYNLLGWCKKDWLTVVSLHIMCIEKHIVDGTESWPGLVQE